MSTYLINQAYTVIPESRVTIVVRKSSTFRHSEQGHEMSTVEKSLFNTCIFADFNSKLHAKIVLCLILHPVAVGVHAVDVIIGFP